MDHSGALRHPADDEAGAVATRLLRARVGGEDRLRGPAPPSRGELAAAAPRPREEPVERQPLADHARRENEHLLAPRRRAGAAASAAVARASASPRPRHRVRAAGVDDDRLRLRELEMLPRDDDRRRLHPVRREHRRPGRAARRADEREVERGAPDAAVDAGGDEAARGGDAHTSTPLRRSPAVSPKPRTRFAFWTA